MAWSSCHGPLQVPTFLGILKYFCYVMRLNEGQVNIKVGLCLDIIMGVLFAKWVTGCKHSQMPLVNHAMMMIRMYVTLYFYCKKVQVSRYLCISAVGSSTCELCSNTSMDQNLMI